jgi:MFS transporter, FHS family, L-fucose permease
MTTLRAARSATARPSQPLAVMVIGLLFFVFGFVTWLNGSLIPYLKIICGLDYTEAFLVTFAFYIAYTVMALPMSGLLARTGYRNGMALGLGIIAVGALVHIPAALLASFPLFLTGLFIVGTGLTVLQTASNPYIVLLGPPESAAKRISIMGVVNKAAGAIVPMVFASLVLPKLGNVASLASSKPTPELQHMLAGRLVLPYLAMAGILLVLVAFVRLMPLPEVVPEQVDPAQDGRRLIDQPRLVLGVATIFAYMGMEVVAGDTIGVFGAHLGVPNFLSLTSYTMAFMVVGYASGVLLIPRIVSQRTALRISGVAGLLMTAGVLLSSPASFAISRLLWGWTGVPPVPDPIFFVAAMGLAHAQVWPTVWPFALKGLGAATPRASALLIMAISGGAVVPLLFGWLSTMLPSMQQAYLVALPCYAIILFYGWRGCTMTHWTEQAITP